MVISLVLSNQASMLFLFDRLRGVVGHGLAFHHFLVFPAVLVGHHITHKILVNIIVAHQLQSFPLSHVAVDNFEALWLT